LDVAGQVSRPEGNHCASTIGHWLRLRRGRVVLAACLLAAEAVLGESPGDMPAHVLFDDAVEVAAPVASRLPDRLRRRTGFDLPGGLGGLGPCHAL